MTNKEQFRCTFKHVKAFFFFSCGRRILQSYRIKELMARKENDLVIKHAEYQIGGEKKK